MTNLNQCHLSKLPQSWFWIGKSSQVTKDTPFSTHVEKHDIVLFRNLKGSVVALSSKCPHLGANLGKGRIFNESIVCPFHAWKFDQSGKCIEIPGSNCSNKRNIRSYHVIERWGHIFLNLCGKRSFPFPRFNEVELSLLSGGYFNFKMKASWASVAGNGFDASHLRWVHKREPTKDPVIDYIDDYGISIHHSYRVAASDLFLDKVIRIFSQSAVKMKYSVYGGNLITVETKLGAISSLLIISLVPEREGGCMAHIFCLAPCRTILLKPLVKTYLWFLGLGAKQFFREEAEELGQIGNFSPKKLHETDKQLIVFYSWLSKWQER